MSVSSLLYFAIHSLYFLSLQYPCSHNFPTFSSIFLFVFRHPLFPLLALLFERCEQATQSAESASSESFNIDIQAFVQHQERDQKPFLINDAEVDGLVSWGKNYKLYFPFN